MNTDRDRVISISLSEAEWQAFTARHPQPVNWLRDRILSELREGKAGGSDVSSVKDTRVAAGL